LERLLRHPVFTPDKIRYAADGLKALASEYPEISEERSEYQARADALRRKPEVSN
jgi:hypothetical protein